MCKVLEVTRSCYYSWLKVTKQEDTGLNNYIDEIFKASYQTYGTRRIKKSLEQKHSLIVSRRRIGRIMKELNLSTRHRKRFKIQTTDSNHKFLVVRNLLKQQFDIDKQDRVYVGDITYIPTKEGRLYLSVVIDLFSRKVVGWSMDDTMETTLVNNSILMAIKSRKPRKGIIWHTDRGSQYASTSHRELLKKYGFIQSMSRHGNCYDNAVAESFFHSLKTELTHHINFENKNQATQAIFHYIEVFYNRKRLHSSNNYLSPVDYENSYYA